jgi:hypothetical protein
MSSLKRKLILKLQIGMGINPKVVFIKNAIGYRHKLQGQNNQYQANNCGALLRGKVGIKIH